MKPLKMKSSKPILFVLAGIWTTLLIMENVISAFSSIKARKTALPFKLVFHSARIIRSALLFCLVIINVFMAIALVKEN